MWINGNNTHCISHSNVFITTWNSVETRYKFICISYLIVYRKYMLRKYIKLQPYLTNQSLYKYQKILAKFCLSAHRLRIETARYNSKNNYVPPEQRLCPNCHLHKVEDEEHFVIECPKYEVERKSLFESASKLSIHFNDLSNYYKFIWIMSNENATLIKEYGIFSTNASEKQALSY